MTENHDPLRDLRDLALISQALKKPELREQIAALDELRQDLAKEKRKAEEVRLGAERAQAEHSRELQRQVQQFSSAAAHIVKDALLVALVWLFLYSFGLMHQLFPVHGRLADWIGDVHAVTLGFSYFWLCLCWAWDMMEPKLGRFVNDWLADLARRKKERP